MEIKTIFEKVKDVLKTKSAVRVIAVFATVLLIGAVILCAVLISGDGAQGSDTYTVVFVSNGGGSVAGLEVKAGDKIPRPANPEREGYIFGGWYVHGIAWNFDINTVRENTVMSAKWLEAVTVTFDTGEETRTVSIAKNSPMRESDAPKIHRDDFAGWFVGGVRWNFSERVTDNLYLVAGYDSTLGFSGELFEPLDELYGATGVTLAPALTGDICLGGVDNTKTEGLLNLLEYLEYMPRLSAFLNGNLSLYEHLSSSGGLYYAPKPTISQEYSFYMNEEWVKLLLDYDVSAEGSQMLSDMYYKPYISDTSPLVTVIATDDYIIKNLDAAGNIIYTMNLYDSDYAFCGAEALNCLLTYIGNAYSSYYSNVPSRIFLGERAVYDTDELVALLRVAVSNPQAFGKSISGIYVDKNDKSALLSLIASLFGIDDINIYAQEICFSGEEVIYEGNNGDIESAVDFFNRMIREGLVSFSDKENALVRYGSKECAEGYTEVLAPTSKRTATGEAWEYVRVSDTVLCDMGKSISLSEALLSEREKLLAALRVIDYMYR